MEKVKINEDQQFGLLKSMNITMKDLDANRSGVLGDTQRRGLRKQQFVTLLFWGFVALLGVIPLIFPGRWMPATDTNQLQMLGIAAFGLGMAFWQQSQIEEVLKENKVAVRTGPIKKTIHTENKSQVYRASIGGRKFEVDKRTYDWLVEDREYSCYYVPQNGNLVSIGRPLTSEEKIQFSFIRARDFEKEKRLEDSAEITDNVSELAENDSIQASHEDSY